MSSNKMVKSTRDFRWGMTDTLHFFKCGNVGISSYSIMKKQQHREILKQY